MSGIKEFLSRKYKRIIKCVDVRLIVKLLFDLKMVDFNLSLNEKKVFKK